LAACRVVEGGYFGNPKPPNRQRLVILIGSEPGSLDPTTSGDLTEDPILHALFEGLTTLHPLTASAMAGLATHLDVAPGNLQYTFFLRGHPQPKGIRLPNRDLLPDEYSRGIPAGLDSAPARWSDGVPITADDFVFSWRRAVDPATAAVYAFLLFSIDNAVEISDGKLPLERLGVRAIDRYTLQITLRSPVDFFPELVASKVFCPVPRHVVAEMGKAWTQPQNFVSNGAFALRERHALEKIILAKNPHYYEVSSVALEELIFFPVLDPTAIANLYRSTDAAITSTTPTLVPLLQHKKDYQPRRIFGTMFHVLKTTEPPFRDVRARYAFNMATDKRALADLIPGETPATTLVPPLEMYKPPKKLLIETGGATIDVLAFNPRAARELLRATTETSKLKLEILYPALSDFRMVAEILQQQWRETLGVELIMVTQDVQTWVQTVLSRNYHGVASSGDAGVYMDPSYFLDQFTRVSGASGSDWVDDRYDAMIADARSTPDRTQRWQKLAECERLLIHAMPVLSLSWSVWPFLVKPFVKGLGANLLDRQQLKYAWIDTNWRPT
jgi:ABC-type oligopeptide transport system substrate-binding subunit